MSGKRRWWSKKAEKENKRLERELAEKKEKARSESKDRRERIKILWDLDQEKKATKTRKEKSLAEQQLKRQKLKKLLSGLPRSDDLLSLVELVGLQNQEIEYLTQFRRDWERIDAHYPDQLENLNRASLFAELLPFYEKPLA